MKEPVNLSQAEIDAFKKWEIDFVKLQRRLYMQRRKELEPRLLEHRKRGEWEKFINMALTCYEVMPLAFYYYDEVPDSLKYNFCIEAYTHHGDIIPAVRKAVRGALKYGKPVLPDEIAAAEEITVYRAGEEPINKAKYRISWTTDKDTALVYRNAYSNRHSSHLYTGKIKPGKIIAYMNDRDEHKIMQYANVYDIQEIRTG